ncbi:MAG: haloacid dehalogenase-like hydrolase [Eubacterium sp.]
MKDIDIYDFDKTIVPFDSGSLFCGYCFLHYPWIIVVLPFVLVGAILMVLKIISFTSFKRLCFMFVVLIPLDKAVKGFWNRHEHQVHKWFHNRKRHAVVISASPDFLLEEIHKRLGFEDLICTRHNRKTGIIIGENCRDEEKVRRLYELYDKESIHVVDVYSDSLKHDKPIFSLGENCYHIVKGEKIPFEFKKIYAEKN